MDLFDLTDFLSLNRNWAHVINYPDNPIRDSFVHDWNEREHSNSKNRPSPHRQQNRSPSCKGYLQSVPSRLFRLWEQLELRMLLRLRNRSHSCSVVNCLCSAIVVALLEQSLTMRPLISGLMVYSQSLFDRFLDNGLIFVGRPRRMPKKVGSLLPSHSRPTTVPDPTVTWREERRSLVTFRTVSFPSLLGINALC